MSLFPQTSPKLPTGKFPAFVAIMALALASSPRTSSLLRPSCSANATSLLSMLVNSCDCQQHGARRHVHNIRISNRSSADNGLMIGYPGDQKMRPAQTQPREERVILRCSEKGKLCDDRVSQTKWILFKGSWRGDTWFQEGSLEIYCTISRCSMRYLLAGTLFSGRPSQREDTSRRIHAATSSSSFPGHNGLGAPCSLASFVSQLFGCHAICLQLPRKRTDFSSPE